MSYRELARAATEAVSRKTPFSYATFHRFLRGDSTSEEIATALAILFDEPRDGTQMVRSPELSRWLRIGTRLHSLAPVYFGRACEALEDVIRVLEKVPPDTD